MMVHIDALFNISDEQMDAAKWEALGQVYRQLPEFLIDQEGAPFWFGIEEPMYLYASVEPPGLQIAGMLLEDDWNRWSEEFIALASKALNFEVVKVSG